MLLTDCTEITVCPRNYTYWKAKGYEIGKVGGKSSINGVQRITVRILDLPPNSNVRVECQCDECGKEFTNRFGRGFLVCGRCRSTISQLGNSHGSVRKGQPNLKMRGKGHPRHNPNRSKMLQYGSKVRWLSEVTYKMHKDTINPLDHPRTLCGTEGGWQLDHKISIKEGFLKGLEPEELARLENLQMLPWAENRKKW